MPQRGQEGGVDRAIQQPMRDLSLIRDQPPASLVRAAAAPYDVSDAATCGQASRELDELDAALGPDLQAGGDEDEGQINVGGLASDLVSGAVGLPFRGIVRTVTGAEQRDRRLREAVLAGMVRRGFIKGRMSLMNCPAATAKAGASP
jgi:hypothetical protein